VWIKVMVFKRRIVVRNISKLLAASTLLVFCVSSYGHDGCIKNSIGQPVCAPPNGGIAKNNIGRVVCGLGQCVKNNIDQVICSNKPGGFATKNSIEKVVCTGGCSEASESKCEEPR
jgi:hypothetical protein